MKTIKISDRNYEILKKYADNLSINQTIGGLIECWGRHNHLLQQIIREVDSKND